MEKISVDYAGHVDRLGRSKFARYLLDLVIRIDTESAGAVIGLEGKWGGGKTHVLKALQLFAEEIQFSDRPLIVQFNPWMISGTKDLVEALLVQIASAIPIHRPWRVRLGWKADVSQGAELANNILSYAGVLSTVKHFSPMANLLLPGSGLLLDAASFAADEATSRTSFLKGPLKKLSERPGQLSLVDARRRVEESISKSGLKIVVLIDDLDRLPPKELGAMIQAVKAVADFSSIVYVLAYDPLVVAKSLEDELRIDSGAAYLEKIIQLAVTLPELPAGKFRNFAASRLTELVERTDLTSGESDDLEQAWQIVLSMVQTPRNVERLRTKLAVSLPVLHGEVNLADVIVLETLSLSHPKIIEWIRTNVDVMMKLKLSQYDTVFQSTGQLGSNNSFLEIERDDEQKISERQQGWRKLLPNDQRINTPLIGALEFLFANAIGKWSARDKRSNFRRVQEYRFWYRWLCFHDHHEQWEASELSDLVANPEKILATGIHLSQPQFIEFCQHVCDLGPESLSNADCLGLAKVFCEASKQLGAEAILEYGLGLGPIPALTIAIRIDSSAKRLEAIRYLLDQDELWLSAWILRQARLDCGAQGQRAELPPDQWLVQDGAELNDLVQRWLAICASALQNPRCFQPNSDYSPYRVLAWMRAFGHSPHDVRALADHYLASENSLSQFFSNFSDRPAHEAFDIEIDWEILPAPRKLYALALASKALNARHTRVLSKLQGKASRFDEIARLTHVLERLSLLKTQVGA